MSNLQYVSNVLISLVFQHAIFFLFWTFMQLLRNRVLFQFGLINIFSNAVVK